MSQCHCRDSPGNAATSPAARARVCERTRDGVGVRVCDLRRSRVKSLWIFKTGPL